MIPANIPPPENVPVAAYLIASLEQGFPCAVLMLPPDGSLRPAYISWEGRYFDKGYYTVFYDNMAAQKYVHKICYESSQPSSKRNK